MPNVPHVPGVPALTSYSQTAVTLALADAALLTSTLLNAINPQWGIFNSAGIPVVQQATIANQALSAVSAIATFFGSSVFPIHASFIDFEIRQDYAVATYPVEQGQFQSYDKVQLPFDLRVRLASTGSGSQRQQFINAMAAIVGDTNLYSVLTPEGFYSGLNAMHFSFRRTSGQGATMIVMDVFFQQIRQTAPSTLGNTSSPVVAPQFGAGLLATTPLLSSKLPAFQ